MKVLRSSDAITANCSVAECSGKEEVIPTSSTVTQETASAVISCPRSHHRRERTHPQSLASNNETVFLMNVSTCDIQRMIAEETLGRSTKDHRALFHAHRTTMFHKQLWRERVSKWCYDVLDSLEESRDVAYVAMNFLDRYLAVQSKETSYIIDVTPFQFEVMAFTALFLAVRICGVNKDLQIPELLQLSSSGAQSRHVLEEGHRMLERISWNHRILTPHSFLKEYLSLFVSASHGSMQKPFAALIQDQAMSLMDFASYLVEVSVCDVYFSCSPPSQVALGAFVVAMTCDSFVASQNDFLVAYFATIRKHTNIDVKSVQMKQILSRLVDVYNQSQEAAADAAPPPSSVVVAASATDLSNANNKHHGTSIETVSNIATTMHIIVEEQDDEHNNMLATTSLSEDSIDGEAQREKIPRETSLSHLPHGVDLVRKEE